MLENHSIPSVDGEISWFAIIANKGGSDGYEALELVKGLYQGGRS